MRILKKRSLWFILYGVAVTALFLYLLFPAELVLNRLTAAADSSAFTIKMDSLKPSVPLGIKLKNITVGSAQPGDVFFQGETLDVQASLLSLLQKRSFITVAGNAYGGNFNGRIGFISWNKPYPPVEGKLSFQNIDLGKYSFIKSEMGRDLAGKVRGSLVYDNASETSSTVTGNLTLFLVKGSYPLAEPFLGLSRIEVDRGEIQAQLKNGVVKIGKLEMSGPQINCSLKGEITLADDFRNSQLNMTGTIEILSKSKMKTNITISGTLANPVSRYI
jgi:type II secretion system protein N